jgi:hypothetical protein
MFLVPVGAVIVALVIIRLIVYRASLVREQELEERIETQNAKRNRIWSEHLKRAKAREPNQASRTQQTRL